jgi:hypothetical protein
MSDRRLHFLFGCPLANASSADSSGMPLSDSEMLLGKWDRVFAGAMRYDGIRVREPYFDLAPILNEIKNQKGPYRKIRRRQDNDSVDRSILVLRRVRDLDSSRRPEAAVVALHTVAIFDHCSFDRLRDYAISVLEDIVSLAVD